jgi:carboxypeptidase T
MRDTIRAVRGRAYEVKSSFELYPTAGTSTDYAFSRHLADASNGKVYGYTIEWGSRENETPFHPPYSEMQNIIREVTAGLLDFCISVVELPQVSTPSTIE